MQCNKCKYVWEYKGTNWNFATCPKCFCKVKIRGNPKDQFLAGMGKYGVGYNHKNKCPHFILKLGTKFYDAIIDTNHERQLVAFIKKIKDERNLTIGIEGTEAEAPAIISKQFSKPATELHLNQFCYIFAIPRVKCWYKGKKGKKLQHERYFEILDIEPLDFNKWAEEHLADDSLLSATETLLGNPSSANAASDFKNMVSELFVDFPDYMNDNFVNMLMSSPQFSFDRFGRSGGISTTIYPGIGTSDKDGKMISNTLSKLSLSYENENLNKIFNMRDVIETSLQSKPLSQTHADFLESWRPLKKYYPEENVTSFVTDMRVVEHTKGTNSKPLGELQHLFRDSLKVESPLYVSKDLLGNIKMIKKERNAGLIEDIKNYALFKRMTVHPPIELKVFEATQMKAEREVLNPESYKELVGEGKALDTNQWAISTMQMSRAMCRLYGKKTLSSKEVNKAFEVVRDSKFNVLNELTEGSYTGMGRPGLEELAYRIYLFIVENGPVKTDEIIASFNVKSSARTAALQQLVYEGYVTQPLLGRWRAIPE